MNIPGVFIKENVAIEIITRYMKLQYRLRFKRFEFIPGSIIINKSVVKILSIITNKNKLFIMSYGKYTFNF